MRIAEAQQTMSYDHGDHGETAANATIDGADGVEDIRCRSSWRARARKFARQYVQQHFRIRARIQMSQIFAREDFGKLGGIRQVPVVAQTNAVG
jgi:hypothetical protein